MFCENCGTRLNDTSMFCPECGAAVGNRPSEAPAQPYGGYSPAQAGGAQTAQPYGGFAPPPPPAVSAQPYGGYAPAPPPYNPGFVGFSQKIHDPVFEQLHKAGFRKSIRNGLIWLPVVVLLFQIAPFFSADFTRPIALGVGCIVGGFGLVATLVGGAMRAGAKTWDGDVIDKKITVHQDDRDDGRRDTYYYHTIIFRLVGGGKKKKRKRLRTGSLGAWDMMTYLEIGDRVRYHGKLDYYEKYDKSRDAEVPCPNCLQYVDIRLESCPKCSVPVIKP